MAASPAQVPNNFNNPWSRQAAEQAVAYQAPVYEYPAVTPAPTTHNAQPAPAYYNQQPLAYPVAQPGDTLRTHHGNSGNPQVGNQQSTPDTKKSLGIGAKLAIGFGAIGVTAATIIGVGKFAAHDTADKIINGTGNNPAESYSGNSSSAYEMYPVKLSPENASGDQFANLDEDYPYPYTTQEQMDYIGPKLNTGQQETVTRMQSIYGEAHFTEDDGVTPRTIALPSPSNSPQQILDQLAVGMFKTWEVAQAGDLEQAKKYAAGVTDPKYDQYDNLISVLNGADPVVITGVAYPTDPTIYSGSYNGVEATTENPVLQFKSRSAMDSSVVVQMVVRFDKGNSDDSGRWRLITSEDV